ncbi:uncharacterized protein BDV14DRAFT_175443 [Aspergillus stella-maris]|uniref:uncharacterized protein n=1 Tax=Aspergillus stella-maris TaxID=1810926 RepID=UPI003CCE4B4B
MSLFCLSFFVSSMISSLGYGIITSSLLWNIAQTVVKGSMIINIVSSDGCSERQGLTEKTSLAPFHFSMSCWKDHLERDFFGKTIPQPALGKYIL